MKKFLFVLFIFFCSFTVYGQEYTLDLASELNLDYIVDADKFKIFLYNQVPNSEYTIEVQSKSNSTAPLTLVTIPKEKTSVTELTSRSNPSSNISQITIPERTQVKRDEPETECSKFKIEINNLIKKVNEETKGEQIKVLQTDADHFLNSISNKCEESEKNDLIKKLQEIKSKLICKLFNADVNELIKKINQEITSEQIKTLQSDTDDFLSRVPNNCEKNVQDELINKLTRVKTILNCKMLIEDYNALVMEINSVVDEKKVNEIRIRIKGFLERLKREECAELWKMEEKLNSVLDKIDGKPGNGKPGIEIPKNSNENLIVTIYNKDKTKKWQYKFSSTPRGEWFPTFGLIFVSHFFNPTVEYIPQKQSDGTIKIGENEKGKGEGEFVPIIAYCWLPNSSNNSDWSWGFSAGLGYTSEAPIMMGAINVTYNRNINFLLGIVGKSIKKPNETFQVGQTVTATEVASLNRTTFTILPQFGITLRLGTNPF